MRRFTFLYLAVICSLLLSACGAGKPHKLVTFMVFGDPAEYDAYRQLVEAFSLEHPSIKVELIHVPSQSDYRARLGADLAAGSAADVVLINYRRYAQFAAAGALEPLGPYLAQSHVIAEHDFYPQAIEPFMWNGQLMCIPQNLSSLVIYYNKDLFTQAGVDFPQPGWTWDDFVQTAISLTKHTDGDGRTDQYGLGMEPSLIRLAPFLWQGGAELVDGDSSAMGQAEGSAPTRLMLDTPEALRVAEFFVSLSQKYHVVPTAEEEAAEDSESRFMNGRTAMYFNSRRGVPTYREITAFDWDVAGLPRDLQAASVLHSDAYCMPVTTDNKGTTWTFIEYANSIEGQTIIAGTGRTVPSLVAVAQSEAFLDPTVKPVSSQVFLDALPDIRALPVLPNWVDIEEIADEEIQRAFYGQTTVYEAMLSAIRRTSIYFGAGE